MTPLAGRRVLLIGIGFYDYETAIAAELRALGAEVLCGSQQPPTTMFGRLRTAAFGRGSALARHHDRLVARARQAGQLDHVIVIKGDLLDDAVLRALRSAQPAAAFTAYHWDSMARYPELVARQALFDRVLTFDRADAAANPSFVLRPLFFRPELWQAPGTDTPEVDLCFVGWLHHDRLAQIEALRRQAQALNLSFRAYLSTGWRTMVTLSWTGRSRDVYARPMAFADYARLTRSARVIVDLPHPQQTGLTMRAIEAIGAGKKLITTAPDVTDYRGVVSGNIRQIDPAAPVLERDFAVSPAAVSDQAATDAYSLRRWVLDVLGIVEPGPFLKSDAAASVPG